MPTLSPQLFLNIGLAILPGLFWLWWFLRKDRARPEPRRLIAATFIAGAIATIPALALELLADQAYPFAKATTFLPLALGSLLVVAPVEEGLKFLVVRFGAFRSAYFDEGIDGVVYMIAAALGFATAENILIVLRDGAGVLPLRLISATLLHALASGLIGYYLGLAKFYPEHRIRFMIEGLVIGIVMHGLYNFIALSPTQISFSLLVGFMIVLYFLLSSSIRDAQKKNLILPATSPPSLSP